MLAYFLLSYVATLTEISPLSAIISVCAFLSSNWPGTLASIVVIAHLHSPNIMTSKGGLYHFPLKFAHFLVPVITFFPFLLCK